MMSTLKELFGGAIVMKLPVRVIDASDLRQVPDTQEVFLYSESGNEGTSIILEVLERVAAEDADEAARFHFDSLAHDNDATEVKVSNVEIRTEPQDNTPPPIILRGSQSIPKFNNKTPDEVQIFMALYRIQNKNVDLVLTMNVATKTSDSRSAISAEVLVAAERDFETAASSLKIVDLGLFG